MVSAKDGNTHNKVNDEDLCHKSSLEEGIGQDWSPSCPMRRRVIETDTESRICKTNAEMDIKSEQNSLETISFNNQRPISSRKSDTCNVPKKLWTENQRNVSKYR